MKNVSLGPLEQEVMSCVWKNKTCTARDVWENLSKDREVAYNTIQTIMTRLVDKGLLKRKLEGKTHVYKPAVRQKNVLLSLLNQTMSSFTGQFGEEALIAFVDGLDDISEETRQKLIEVFALGAYLLITKTTLHPQLFITACGEVLKNIQEHVHFNPDGVLSSLILFVTTISVSLALFQLIKFVVSHRRLHRFQAEETLPDNLKTIVSKHDLSQTAVVVDRNNKLTAYTIGLFKPKIIVSSALIAKLSHEQLEAVVLHELHHLRSRHLLWLLLSKLISSLFFFIPLVEYLAQQLKTEFELAADAFVVEKQKTRDHLCGSLALNIQY
ncbi:MAG: Transcriptional repressor, CopY family, partial [Candidatus Levybacteria bacterium GW2011_GWA1_39_11]